MRRGARPRAAPAPRRARRWRRLVVALPRLRPPTVQPDPSRAPLATEATPLLHRVAQGERAAVNECVARYGGVVWALARRLSPSEGEAEDAAQEIFIDLWRSAGRYDPSVLPEVSFVAMIARRRLIDRRRSQQRAPASVVLDEAEATDAQTSPETGAEAAIALRAVAELRPEQREILLMSAVQGLSHEEIAQSKNMPLGTVKAHARRALLRVRALLSGTPEEGTP